MPIKPRAVKQRFTNERWRYEFELRNSRAMHFKQRFATELRLIRCVRFERKSPTRIAKNVRCFAKANRIQSVKM